MEAIGGLGCIEQPVPSTRDMAILARRLKTPLMADEAIYAPAQAIDVIREEAASIALMKMNKHGGPSAVREIGAIFGAANLTLSIAIYYDLIAVAAAHLAAAIPCATWPSPATDLADTFVDASFAPQGLTPRRADGPGLGRRARLGQDRALHRAVVTRRRRATTPARRARPAASPSRTLTPTLASGRTVHIDAPKALFVPVPSTIDSSSTRGARQPRARAFVTGRNP